MVKKFLLTAFVLMSGLALSGQTLEKYELFNEPSQWNISGNEFSMLVTPKSDYWRHIALWLHRVMMRRSIMLNTAESSRTNGKGIGRLQGTLRPGRHDDRIDHENYIKAGIEYVDGKYKPQHSSNPSHIRLERHRPRQACRFSSG